MKTIKIESFSYAIIIREFNWNHSKMYYPNDRFNWIASKWTEIIVSGLRIEVVNDLMSNHGLTSIQCCLTTAHHFSMSIGLLFWYNNRILSIVANSDYALASASYMQVKYRINAKSKMNDSIDVIWTTNLHLGLAKQIWTLS